MKDNIKEASLNWGIDITKMHGHMDIYLTDVKTGEVEEVHEENMMTNALQEYFRNCGFLNYPNVNQSNMVEELLGGVMGFDEEIDEDATIVHVPAGHKMIFNGSVGTLNNSAPTELGSYSADESGWQADGSYVQTYDYSTSQANGTISCVCLTGKNYGYAGEGNSTSLVRHSTKVSIANLGGTVTSYSGISGDIFGIDLADSSCYSFSIENVTVEEETVKKGFLRKWRLPISKINIKGTQTAPIMISEAEVTLDSDIVTYASDSKYGLMTQPLGQNLVIWNINRITHIYTGDNSPVWGTNWSQYVWTLTPTGTLTKETLVNTSGDTLHGIQAAVFDDDYIYFVWAHGRVASYNYISHMIDTTTVYIFDRSTGAITAISNPYGYNTGSGSEGTTWQNLFTAAGWNLLRALKGRLVTTGSYSFVVDAVNEECYPTNASSASYGNLMPVTGLIRSIGNNLYRDQSYIATINNLDTPIVKTADKTMKVVYRITFDEEAE